MFRCRPHYEYKTRLWTANSKQQQHWWKEKLKKKEKEKRKLNSVDLLPSPSSLIVIRRRRGRRIIEFFFLPYFMKWKWIIQYDKFNSPSPSVMYSIMNSVCIYFNIVYMLAHNAFSWTVYLRLFYNLLVFFVFYRSLNTINDSIWSEKYAILPIAAKWTTELCIFFIFYFIIIFFVIHSFAF